MKIYKYPIIAQTKNELLLPNQSKILTFQSQKKELFIWALISESELSNLITRHFYLFGTGHEIDYLLMIKLNYIGTTQQYNGQFVWHLFEDLSNEFRNK